MAPLLQINHLSHLLLTLELLPVMLESSSSTGDGRIIFLTCKAHEFADGWNPEKMNLEYTEDCMRIEAFNVSKLCNVRFLIL